MLRRSQETHFTCFLEVMQGAIGGKNMCASSRRGTARNHFKELRKFIFCLLFVIILTAEVVKRYIESTVCQQSNLPDC